MKTPLNSRDSALQETAIRVLGVSTNYINLTCPTQQFKYGTDNVAQPASTIVTATLVGALQGTVTFSTTGFSQAPTVDGNQLTVDPDKITGDFATISATLVYQGETYTAVPVSISKIFNQLVARITTPNSPVPSYSDGTGYTLPTADNFIELYNGVVKLTTGVVYGPATQTKNGLTVAVNSSTGRITVSEVNPNTWTSTTENFTLTATRGTIAYNATYTITKAKQGFGGQQVADIELYQWSTAQPAVPTGTSTYTWATKAHSYTNTDSWRTTVSANPGVVGIKLWRVTKAINAPAEAATPTYVTTWASGATVLQITTDANAYIKTRIAIVYKNDISPPVPPAGTSTYNWETSTISAAPSGWTLIAEDTPAGFTLYQAAVDLLAAQSETSSTIDWTLSSITPIRYSGGNAVATITAALTNAAHVIPVNTTGSILNFANTGTDLFVYEGATPLVYDGIGTTTGTFKVTTTVSGVTAGAASAVTANSATGVRFANLSAASFATGSTGTITYLVSGRRLSTSPGDTNGTPFTYTLQQTFSKKSSGSSGSAGSAFWFNTSASVVQKNSSGVFNPTTVTIAGKQAATTAGTISNYSAWYKIFKNNDTVAVYTSSVAQSDTVYTLTGSSTYKLRIESYSNAGFTNLIDQETVYVVSDTSAGQTDAVARRAYVVVTTTPAATPASLVVTGDSLPTAGTWFTGKTYSYTAPTTALAENESLYQVDGVYVSGGNTTWGYPYLSSLKVGNLQAISANTGALTVTGNIKGGSATAIGVGSGYYMDSAGKFRVGTGNTSRLVYDEGLTIYNDTGGVVLTTSGKINWSAVAGTDNAPQSNSTRNTFRGAWVTGTSYIVGDIVYYNNASYSCIVDSTGNILPTNTSFWTLYAAAGASVKLQYSPDNINWFDAYELGHLYVRSGTKDVGSTTYTYGIGTKFVPVLGVDYYQPATFDITNTGVTFKKNDAGAVSPDSVTLSTAFANIAGTISYQWQKNGTNISSATSSSYAVPKADYNSVTTNTYTCVISGTINGVAGTRSDSITIPLLEDGSSAVQVLVSNENISFTADTTGYSGISFANGGSVITAYLGSTQLAYAASGANTFNASISNSNVTVANGTGSGNTYTIPAPTAMSAETGTTTVTVTIRNAANVATTVTIVISYSLTRKGVKGDTPVKGVDYFDGDPGTRGSLTGYGTQYSIYGTWTDARANRVIYNMVTGQTSAADLSSTAHLRIGDTVVLTNNSTAANSTDAVTKYWDGDSWEVPGVVFNGNVLVNGTISADKLNTNTALIGHEIKNAAGTFVINFGSSPYISISV